MPEKFLSTGQAAKLCSVTRDTVLKWIKVGKVQAVQTAGGHYRIKLESLGPYLSDRETADPSPAEERTVTFCWEYHADQGEIRRDCRKCMVFKSQAQKCYLMAGLGKKGGHSGAHCKDNCYECEYFRFVKADKINVLLVSQNELLKTTLESGVSERVNLRVVGSEYATAAALHDFRPDFVVIDDSLASGKVEELCAHLLKDPRAGGAQIILGSPRGRGGRTLPVGVCASIHLPFSASEMEGSFDQLRKSLWGAERSRN